jgi:hypothetical protein
MTPAAALTAVASLIPWSVYQTALREFKAAKYEAEKRITSELKEDHAIHHMFHHVTTIESDLILRYDKGDKQLPEKIARLVFGVDIAGLKQKLQNEVASWVKKRGSMEVINVGSTPHNIEHIVRGEMFKWIDRLNNKLAGEREVLKRYKIARKKLSVVSRAVAWLISMLKVNAKPPDTNSRTVKKLQTSHWISVSKYMQQIEFNRKIQKTTESESA